MRHGWTYHRRHRFQALTVLIFLTSPLWAESVYGQATEPEGMRSPLERSVNPGPSSPFANMPRQVTEANMTRLFTPGNSSFMPPINPAFPPTYQQTQTALDHFQALRNLDPMTRFTIVYGGAAASSILSGPTLPNGTPNPFFKDGHLTPNYFFPSTWSSPTMSWQSVGPEGWLPNASATT